MSAREGLAAVLVQHQRIPLFDDTGGQRCVGCDHLRGETDGPNSPRHAAHLADVILDHWLPGALADERVVEAAVDVIWREVGMTAALDVATAALTAAVTALTEEDA